MQKSKKNKSAVSPANSGGDHPAIGFMPPTSSYIGRFAPSPTGPLHFGSLVSALASFLDARHNHGKWLVRIEDIDPPREQPGASKAILQCLEDHGLCWDGEVVFQSQRSEVYNHFLSVLENLNALYACNCTRQDLQAMGGIYNGHCRAHPADRSQPHALRLKFCDYKEPRVNEEIRFIDLIQGCQTQDLPGQVGDQILKRKDGLYAYQLAVVVDDIEQGITQVIRGSDLLEVTPRQIFLFELLRATVPRYGHVTLATHKTGQKLSKQNLAPALKQDCATQNLWHALAFLRQSPPVELLHTSATEILTWAINNWKLTQIAGLSAPVSPDYTLSI